MVGSFIVLAIISTLRITAGTLTGKFRWMGKVITILNYGVYVALALFLLFVAIALKSAIFGGGRKSRRETDNLWQRKRKGKLNGKKKPRAS